MPSEKELLSKLADAEKELLDARRALTEARKRWTDAETDLISAKINSDRIKEELRVHRNTSPTYEPTPEDIDLKRFRQANPELMEWVRERDDKKEE